MAEVCKHSNAHSSENQDSGAHIAYCPDCRTITHVCFKPLEDQIERQLEEIRGWGVHYSKGHARPSDAAAVQRRMEEILAHLREAMLMARITKNEIVERLARLFEARGEGSVAAAIRDFKLEVAIPEPEKK